MIKYYDNLKINFFLLGEGPTDAINDRVSTAEKIYLILILSDFALHWWINICILEKTEACKFQDLGDIDEI